MMKKKQSCWKGYKALGTKKSPSGAKTSGGNVKRVNNCKKK
tara:strand:+ start:231 stop:353 length:123 start_codon:yes stop_codon:yes gene_type:complete